jgi:serine/threonine-protein kinase
MRGLPDLSLRRLTYQLFAEALELPPDARQDFLDKNCMGAAQVRSDIEALLRIAGGAGVDTGVLDSAPFKPDEVLVGRVVGRFRLREYIGEGGMGVVYLAERTDGVQQLVAIKLVSSVLAKAAQSRFVREAQILARLEHSSVARLIDAGVEDGRAWIAMEYVRGERIDTHCESRKLSAAAIVRLLLPLAGAISAAHALLVVHSDIKPANVLVTADGQPKLIDFGISTALREAGSDHAPTVNIGRLFSPHYAAAEQVDGRPVTVATDVFGLGALAYRLLTGVPIHAQASSGLAYLLAVTQQPVESPSRAARNAGRTEADARLLRGDLDAILSKALERDPARRYASAADFQSDLQRYLDARPVLARAPSAGYRLGKFLRRNALAVGLSSAACVSLIAGGGAAWIQARNAAIARDMTARRGQFLETLLKSADPRAVRGVSSVAELLDAAAATLDSQLGNEPLMEASMLGLIANTNDGLARYPQGLAASERQLALLEAHGGSPIELGRALNIRGELLREQGKWTQAESVVRRAVALLEPLDAPEDLAQALYLLATVLSRTHREQEAEAIYLKEIDVESRGDLQLQNRRMYPYQALTSLFVELGRYAEADAYGRKALELARRTLPADHPDRLGIEGQYASVLVNDGKLAEAQSMLRDVIARESRVSGASHKDTLLYQWLYADDLIELHHDAEAATLAHATALQLDALLGADNMYSLSAWLTFGVASCNSGDFTSGLEAARRVQAERRRTLPAGDRALAVADLAIGQCLYRSGEYVQAEAMLLQASAKLEAARGPAYRRTQETYRSLRDLYATTGRGADAERFAAKLVK